MTLSSDDFDGEIRGPLYDALHAFTVLSVPETPQTKALHAKIAEAVGLADDYRIDLMDQEDVEEEHD